MDSNIKRSIILDNYQSPNNKERKENNKEYEKINTRSNSCIDNIDLYLKINNNTIEDITFDGEACVISTSTTNIMINLLKGHTIKEALEIIKNYDNMIEEKKYDKEILKEAVVYDDISKQPSRIKCATLTWNGISKKLQDLEEK